MTIKQPVYWEKFKKISLKNTSVKNKELNDEVKKLVCEFKTKGYIKLLPLEALNIDDAVICHFYLEVGKEKLLNGFFPSPVVNNEDSSWMYHSDFCFLNVRATGTETEKAGNFINALKLLPVIRASAIHLAPFFDCALNNLYAVDSFKIISPDVISGELLKNGIDGDEQLKLLIDGIHILGKTAGFDLEPHTSQFSRVALENPDYFRWIRLDKKRKNLYGSVSHGEMLKEEKQKKLTGEIKRIINKVLKENKLKSVEDISMGIDIVKKSHREITDKLIEGGYWTLPSHTWGGAGLPEFSSYNFTEKYPEFTYFDTNGDDHYKHSFGMLTPYKFYTNLPFNRIPKEKNLPVTCKDTVEFFKSIFISIQEKYGFDFVRLDYVDHVFDSTLNNSMDIPVSDRMTPSILKEVIGEAKKHRKYTGAIAERMGCDIEEYKKLGFDLVLGTTVLTTFNSDYMKYNFDLQEQLERNMEQNAVPASVMFAVDTHDSGHPLFWTAPLSEVVGPDGMHLRHFLSRFTWTGKGRRPKYEVIGNQDLSYGLYEGNNKVKSLVWKNDEKYNTIYNGLEDVYERFKELIIKSHFGPLYVAEDCAFWFLDREDGIKERLLCVAALEKEICEIKNYINQKPVYEPVYELLINFREDYTFDEPEIFEIDLITGEFKLPNQISQYQVAIKEVPPLGTKLFFIREKG